MGDVIYNYVQRLIKQDGRSQYLFNLTIPVGDSLTQFSIEKAIHFSLQFKTQNYRATDFAKWVPRPEEPEILALLDRQTELKFQDADKREFLGILIEGLSGVGKTALATNVCLTWMHQNQNKNHLFTQVVFPLPLDENERDGYALLAEIFTRNHLKNVHFKVFFLFILVL